MSKASDKDTILKKIKKIGPIDITVTMFEDKDFFDLLNRYQIDLEYDKYISVINFPSEGVVIDSTMVDITRDGQVFLNRGGYVAQRNKIVIDAIWNRGNILVAVCTAIVSYCTYSKMEIDKRSQAEQKQTTDSLKTQFSRMDSVMNQIKQRIAPNQKISR